jgi:O-antigen/teichoic acid export membrane protein
MPMMRPMLPRLAGSLADQVLSVGAVFLVHIVLARSQSAAEYGAFALAYSVYTFLSGIHNGLLLEAFTVHASGRYSDGFDSYWRYSFRVNLLLSCGMSGVLMLVAAVLTLSAAASAACNYAALALATPVMLTSLFMRRVLYIEDRSARAGVMSCIFFVLVALMLWMASSWQLITSVTVLVMLAVAGLLSSLVFLHDHLSGGKGADFLRRNGGYLAEHWKYSRWVLLTALVFQLNSQGYLWLSALLLDMRSVAELRAAWNVVQPATILFGSLSILMLPRLSRLCREQAQGTAAMKRELLRYGLIVVALGGLSAVAIWMLGGLVYSLLYSGKYDGSVGLLYVAALLPLAVGLAGVYSDALRAAEKPKLVFCAYVVGGVLTFAVGVPAIMHHGAAGAAWGMVASNAGYALTLVACFSWLRRRQARTVPRA